MMPFLNVPVKRILVVAWLALAGCRDSDKNSSLIFEELNESLERSIRIAERASKLELYELKEKEKELAFDLKAKYWHDKADTIHLLSNNLVAFVDSMQQKFKKGKADNLQKDSENIFGELNRYKSSIIELDSAYLKEFNKKDAVITNKYLKKFDTGKEFWEKLSEAGKKQIFISFLEIKNDIRVAENDLLNFSKNQFGGCVLDYTKIFAIVSQNKSQLKPGEDLIIKMGIGQYSTACMPSYIVEGKEVVTDKIGIGVCTINTESQSGKYRLPVKIYYTDLKGERKAILDYVEYTIDK